MPKHVNWYGCFSYEASIFSYRGVLIIEMFRQIYLIRYYPVISKKSEYSLPSKAESRFPTFVKSIKILKSSIFVEKFDKNFKNDFYRNGLYLHKQEKCARVETFICMHGGYARYS